MGGVEPFESKESEVNTTHSDSGRNGGQEKVGNEPQNIDSGYHSTGCASNERKDGELTENGKMITTVRGHFEEFPPPKNLHYQCTMQENKNYISRSPTMPRHYRDVTDRGYNSLPDINAMRNNVKTSLPPSSDRNFSTVEVETPQSQRNQDTEKLAEKIAFCLKLGYSVDLVRTTLKKLGKNASKNDILSEMSNQAEISCSVYVENGEVLNEGKEDSKSRGSGNSALLIPRGPSTLEDDANDNLRPIVIDGSNVAMSHGNKEYFSCKGIQIAVQYFMNRGHRDITVFVPKYRKEQTRPDAPIKDQEILTKLSEDRILVWTPSRTVSGRRITCYDDRFILKLAQETEGVIVSNDNFRDLQNEKQEWKEVIEKRLLMYSFVNDRFMLPDDPLGRNGPSLDNFLRIRLSSEEKKKPECPYGKKCTYGKKCKYFHPECPIPQRSVTDSLKVITNDPSTAQSLAREVMDDPTTSQAPPHYPSFTQHSGKKDHSPPKGNENNNSARNIDATDRHTASPSNLGASAASAPVDHIHVPTCTSGLANDLNRLNIGHTYTLPPQSGGYMYPHTRTEGQNSNPTTVSMSLLQAPSPHSTVGRTVMSSTTPQHYPHLQMQPHSSPPAISMKDKGGYPCQQPQQQVFPNMTYPSIAQPQVQNFPPQIPVFNPNSGPPNNVQNNLVYHWLGYQQAIQQMSLNPGSMNPPQSMPNYPAYMYPNPHSQMLGPNCLGPRGNLTTPSACIDPAMYDASRQAYSSPNPMNQRYMMSSPRSQPGSNPYPMPTIHQNSSNNQQPQFKDPSHPRYNLYKNLCALFSSSTVESVLLSYPQEDDPKKLAMHCCTQF